MLNKIMVQPKDEAQKLMDEWIKDIAFTWEELEEQKLLAPGTRKHNTMGFSCSVNDLFNPRPETIHGDEGDEGDEG